MALLAEIAVPVPLGQVFSYLVPPELAAGVRPGARVLCEFGRRRVAGIVLRVGEREAPVAKSRLKPLLGLLDGEPALPEELLHFLQELASYYFAPVGEVMRLALPAVERERLRSFERQGTLGLGEQPGGVHAVGGRRLGVARATDRLEAAGSLRGQAAAVLALLRAEGEMALSDLERRFGNARSAVKRLGALGLVELGERARKRAPVFGASPERDHPPTLNDAQVEAVRRIELGFERQSPSEPRPDAPHGFLLFGITGSGKTEVYMRVIATCLAARRGALVLVPEIALTPQLLGRFRARFGDDVALLHSGLQPADRFEMWRKLRQGELRVAIGARSALFAPVPELGLVVVDEEHDGSFKQEEGVRYHARDMALLRAHRAGAVVVLGSATPSLEAVALVRRGTLEQIELPERAHEQARLPSVETIDLRRVGPGPTGDKLISLPLHRALERVLAAGEQAILFLNRRGFAPSVICESCGQVQSCKACSVALTFHRRGGGQVRCHYCDFCAPLPERCSECGQAPLSLEGLGTEKLEGIVAQAFPSARVARLDRDVSPGARSEAVLDRMRAGEIDILVGTQMVTKGHDLPRVTLVGVVNADAALSLPDFRAAERGFQLLVQVAGRAGRHDRPGHVLIQTRDPGQPAIAFAARHDVAGFLEHELGDRRELGYPPFRRMALVRVDGPGEQDTRRVAAKLAVRARLAPEVGDRRCDVLGPAPAPIARLRGRYRFRLLLRAAERPALRAVLRVVQQAWHAEPDRHARVALDVDPISML
jgi:primosomal protein N' (replication factor Y) (superfamily II helicase)